MPVPWQWWVVAAASAVFGVLHMLTGFGLVVLPAMGKPNPDPFWNLVGSALLLAVGVLGAVLLVIGAVWFLTAVGLVLGWRWASMASAVLLGLVVAGSLSLLLRGLMAGTVVLAPVVPLGFAVVLLGLLASGASARKRRRATSLLSA